MSEPRDLTAMSDHDLAEYVIGLNVALEAGEDAVEEFLRACAEEERRRGKPT